MILSHRSLWLCFLFCSLQPLYYSDWIIPIHLFSTALTLISIISMLLLSPSSKSFVSDYILFSFKISFLKQFLFFLLRMFIFSCISRLFSSILWTIIMKIALIPLPDHSNICIIQELASSVFSLEIFFSCVCWVIWGCILNIVS